jgi:GxxExxY protein
MLDHEEITRKIIGAFFHVYNTLGYGFLEKVYENALIITLRKSGLQVEQQVRIPVLFEGEVVGDYIADLLVEGKVIVEVKAADALCEAHEAQLLNYLRATGITVGLLLNFGKEATFRRKAASLRSESIRFPSAPSAFRPESQKTLK